MKERPSLSVIMPVYNASLFLDDAIRSILNQTFTNFEFIIIDDGSTDDSLKVIKSYKDKRIRIISRGNKGLGKTLNEGIGLARGEFIARQDADDISEHHRLERQISFLRQNKDISLVGANYRVIFENGNTWFSTNLFTRPDDLKLAIIVSNQFGHGAVMARKRAVEEVGAYNPDETAEDYDLWSKISHGHKIANIKEVLYSWRYYETSLSTNNPLGISESVLKIVNREFDHYLMNKSSYNHLCFSPFSVRKPLLYPSMKGSLYRNISLLYAYRDVTIKSILFLLAALINEPWDGRNYKHLFVILFQRQKIDRLKYDEYIQ